MIISQIQDSISILISLQMFIDECLDIVGKERHDKNSKIHALACAQLTIYVASFIEEWENLGSKCRDDSRVIFVRKISSPFIKKVRQWSDLISFRNNYLAHCFRDRNGNNVLFQRTKEELDIPRGYGDFILLGGCIFCAKEILLREFAVEYNEMLPYLKSLRPPMTNNKVADEHQAKFELDKLCDESERIKQEFNRAS